MLEDFGVFSSTVLMSTCGEIRLRLAQGSRSGRESRPESPRWKELVMWIVNHYHA